MIIKYSLYEMTILVSFAIEALLTFFMHMKSSMNSPFPILQNKKMSLSETIEQLQRQFEI